MQQLTHYARQKIPFAFVLSYDKRELIVEPLAKLDRISFKIDHGKHYRLHPLIKHPIGFKTYQKAFDRVIEHIKNGNTYLLNLTFATRLELESDLKQIYDEACAKYKVMLKDRFVSFSPETFVRIKGQTISTYPMKGTIASDTKDAKKKLLQNPKEMAEHTMIVDLLRNDLGIVGSEVAVKKFRYIQDVGGLLQASSLIEAKVPQWQERLGEIIDAITPAGSITGTPKKKTCEIIEAVERDDRGFFSGIFGVYDGQSFDSCVLIRSIEKANDGYYYRSGGGITIDSDAATEYAEMLQKIYLSKKA